MSRVLLLVFLAILAQSAAHAETLYRLDGAATLQQGCFAPCRCPEPGPEITLRGTFVLGPVTPGDVFDFREITELYWTVSDSDNPVHTITGSGVYKVTNFSPKRQQSLELNLSIDGAPPIYFFSDLESLETKEPVIDLLVSMNGLYCYDTVMRVIAAPVPPQEIIPYSLDADSTFQQGCFDPCDCILEEPRPMKGGFSLIPLFLAGNWAEYAVVELGFAVPAADGVPALTLTGAGQYTLIQGFAGPIQTMQLRVVVDDLAPAFFDRELDNTTTLFPNIDITVDMNDMVCFDQILSISASPLLPGASHRWPAVAPAARGR